MVDLSESYWTNRYKENQTGWDINGANPFLIEEITKFNKEIKILIPGAGNAHEAEVLYRLGYKNIYVLDISNEPLKNLKSILPDFPKDHLIHENYFDHNSKYDLIMEQTFFCALNPSLRVDYVEKTYGLLNDKGIILGLLFNKEMLEGPPFGGNIDEYISLFSIYFENVEISPCDKSIKPRLGKECFIKIQKSLI